MSDHDALYHRLFSHPALVRQLLDAFVPPELLDGLEPERMERVNATFHEARSGTRRSGDVIWRLPGREGEGLHLCLMLEFQAKDDRLMALRVAAYQILLLQQLAAARQFGRDGRLPPVLTLVIYNGEERWRAPTAFEDLVGLPADSPLWPWQPRARYHLLDMGAFPGEALRRPGNLAALLFRLERGQPDPSALDALVGEVIEWFRRHPDHEPLMGLFTALVRDAVAVLDPSARVPDDMREMRAMLSTQVKPWTEQWKAKGLALGRAQGRAEGRDQRSFGTAPATAAAAVR